MTSRSLWPSAKQRVAMVGKGETWEIRRETIRLWLNSPQGVSSSVCELRFSSSSVPLAQIFWHKDMWTEEDSQNALVRLRPVGGEQTGRRGCGLEIPLHPSHMSWPWFDPSVAANEAPSPPKERPPQHTHTHTRDRMTLSGVWILFVSAIVVSPIFCFLHD